MAHPVADTPRLRAAAERLRPVIAGLPDAEERISHRTPTYFTGPGRRGRTFASLRDEREYGEGRLCLWLAAPDGMQRGLVAGDPRRYFVPPYVGHRGWVGLCVDLPDTDREDVAAAVEDAFVFVAERG
jgi:hypothetical protein